jgi:hypothetical protein
MLRGPIRLLTMLILSATVLWRCAAGTPCAAQARPNIVFVLTDDLDLNLVQFMPHVVEMERNGVSFANYFVTAFAARRARRSSPVSFPMTAAYTATSSPMAAMAGSMPTATNPAPSRLPCSAAVTELRCSANI